MLADDPPGVYATGYPTENRQKDVDEEVAAAASFQQDGDGWDEDGEEVEEDVAVGGRSIVSHLVLMAF